VTSEQNQYNEIPQEIDIPTPPRKKLNVFDWLRFLYFKKRRLFWLVIGAIVVTGCCLLIGIVSLFNSSPDSQPEALSVEKAIAQLNATMTMQAALDEAMAVIAAQTETPSPMIVVFNCPECIESDGSILPITLWQSPDDIGYNSPQVIHGEQCILLGERVTVEGVDRSLVDCPAGKGWTRTESLVPPGSETILSNCQPASDMQRMYIEEGLAEGNYIQEAFTARSTNYADSAEVWVIAARIYGPSIETGTEPGVWAVLGSPEQPGIIMAINDIAKGYTPYPDGATTNARVTINAAGVSEVMECAK